MVLGFFEGSMVILALKKSWPALVVVVSSPLQTRFICLTITSGTGWPSAEPDTIDHSPCNWDRSFLTASFSAAQTGAAVTAARPIRITRRTVFIFHSPLQLPKSGSVLRWTNLAGHLPQPVKQRRLDRWYNQVQQQSRVQPDDERRPNQQRRADALGDRNRVAVARV